MKNKVRVSVPAHAVTTLGKHGAEQNYVAVIVPNSSCEGCALFNAPECRETQCESSDDYGPVAHWIYVSAKVKA